MCQQTKTKLKENEAHIVNLIRKYLLAPLNSPTPLILMPRNEIKKQTVNKKIYQFMYVYVCVYILPLLSAKTLEFFHNDKK